ncbi:MAG: hypothetical protein RL363_389 [Bacteroidota bacterium]|jgi:LAO/AO transport system kinase
MFAITDINKGVTNGDFLLLAKTISHIENKSEGVGAFLEALVPSNIPVIGITGPPGAGKSTLISALIGEWIKEGKKVAVLSVDPSSPFHKGALLGDRIRMKEWYLNPNVFIRSLASRGHLGGLTSSMIELTTLLQSVGFDVVVLETVGVGQSEVEVASLAETTIVVLVPEAGDEVQMMKSGLMEVADLFVVNKSDRPDAEVFTNHIQQMLMEAAHDTGNIKVVKTVASQGVGIQELIAAINEHHETIAKTGGDPKLILSKVLQLIVAQKMRQIDLKEMNEKLLAAYAKPQFNIFKFAQSFY